MYNIRQFNKEMQSQVMEFYKMCLPQSGRSFEPDGVHKCLTEIEKNFDYFLCLFDGTAIIGTTAIKSLSENKCELRSVYLLEKYQGQSLGTKMTQEAISFAKNSGYHEIYLDTISRTSQKAISMYRRCGFIETDRYKNTINSDFFMKLIL